MFDQVLSIDQMEIAAKYVLSLLQPGAMVFFEGQLGTGKTTLCKKIVGLFGVDCRFCSPTFTYKNYYGIIKSNCANKNITNCNVYHFDLYRLTSFDQLYSLELIESLLDENGISLVEWPFLLSNSHKFDNKVIIFIKISYENADLKGAGQRRIIIEKKVDRKSNLFDI